MATHKHRADPKQHRTVGWTHCVAPYSCDGAPHGAVTHRDVCRCGAVRLTESNGRHQASSGWRIPEAKAEAR